MRRSAAGAFGSHHAARRAAMRFIRKIAALPGGATLIKSFDYTYDLPETQIAIDGNTFASPIGVIVSQTSQRSTTVFRSMGFGFACEKSDVPAGAIVSDAVTVEGLLAELDKGAPLIVANKAVIAEGPAIAQRVNETLSQ